MKSLNKLIVPKSKPALNESIGRGTEIAVSVLVFTLIGLALDSAFDTRPWFTIGLVIFSTVGSFVRMYYTYNAQMASLEQDRREQSRASR
jgi:F0F1-type ATP synthase assembly protein I